MPSEHSSPPISTVIKSESQTLDAVVPKPSMTTSASTGFASLFSSNTDDSVKQRQKLEKYKKKLREIRAEQDVIVNKQIAAATNGGVPSQRQSREFEQKMHVLAGKAQKLGRSIAAIEEVLHSPGTNLGSRSTAASLSQSGTPPPDSQSKPSTGKSLTSTGTTPPNPPAPIEQQFQRAASTSTSSAKSVKSAKSQPSPQLQTRPEQQEKSSTMPGQHPTTYSNKPLGKIKESITKYVIFYF